MLRSLLEGACGICQGEHSLTRAVNLKTGAGRVVCVGSFFQEERMTRAVRSHCVRILRSGLCPRDMPRSSDLLVMVTHCERQSIVPILQMKKLVHSKVVYLYKILQLS